MTLFPNKSKHNSDNKLKIAPKIGITVISSNLIKKQNAVNRGNLKLK